MFKATFVRVDGSHRDADVAGDQVLDFTAAGRQSNRRLTCRFVMNNGIQGIVVRIADPQV
jgi:hypothetical protein